VADRRTALVTGSVAGIGNAIARALGAAGHNLVLNGFYQGVDPEDARAALAREFGIEAIYHPADLTRPDEIKALADAAIETFGGVDILVNNAGTSAAASLEAVDDDAWQADIDLKLMAAVRFCRRLIPVMRERGGGSIVNAAIVGGKAPAARALPTSVTRAAGINLTKSLANEYAADNIRVNAICIGLIKSAQWERRAGNRPLDEFYAEIAKRIPLGRVGEAEDYADLVAFLVSERARFITGAAVNLDGGMSAVV
jgi:3-oxoacyl-[acyl-carrier protein] reductase